MTPFLNLWIILGKMLALVLENAYSSMPERKNIPITWSSKSYPVRGDPETDLETKINCTLKLFVVNGVEEN